MSKEYHTSDGARYIVKDTGEVFGPHGFVGQVNHFNEFVSADGSCVLKTNDFGDVYSTDGSIHGKKYDNNYIAFDKKPETSTTSSSASYSSDTIAIFRGLKFGFLGIALIVGVLFNLFLVSAGIVMTLSVFLGINVVVSALIVLGIDALIIAKIVSVIKKKRKSGR